MTDIAVMAAEGDALRLLCPDFPISRVGNNVLYAHYHAQQDFRLCTRRTSTTSAPVLS